MVVRVPTEKERKSMDRVAKRSAKRMTKKRGKQTGGRKK